jgi:hypothetical protein
MGPRLWQHDLKASELLGVQGWVLGCVVCGVGFGAWSLGFGFWGLGDRVVGHDLKEELLAIRLQALPTTLPPRDLKSPCPRGHCARVGTMQPDRFHSKI